MQMQQDSKLFNKTTVSTRRGAALCRCWRFPRGLLTGCKSVQGATTGPMGPMPVTVVKIQPVDVPLKREWVGTLDGYVNAQIQPQVSGYLVKQDYSEGSQVEKGAGPVRDRSAAISGSRSIKRRGSSDRPKASSARRRRNWLWRRSM